MQEVYSNPTMFSIKEVASLLCVSQSTLRNWETIYSLPVERNTAGQRKYTANTFTCLEIIKKNLSKGLQQQDIKEQIQQQLQGYNSPLPTTEVIQDFEETTNHNFNLVVKPYMDRIVELEAKNNETIQELKILIAERATLAERVSNKDDIISFQNNSINELKERLQEAEARLNRKWYSFFWVNNK